MSSMSSVSGSTSASTLGSVLGNRPHSQRRVLQHHCPAHQFSAPPRDQQKLRPCLLVNSPALPGPCANCLSAWQCLAVLPACPVPRPGFLNVPRVRLGIVKAVCVFPAPWPLRAAMAPWSPVTVGPPWPFGALCAGQSSVDPILAGVPYGVSPSRLPPAFRAYASIHGPLCPLAPKGRHGPSARGRHGPSGPSVRGRAPTGCGLGVVAVRGEAAPAPQARRTAPYRPRDVV
jgi:hypothetical protein